MLADAQQAKRVSSGGSIIEVLSTSRGLPVAVRRQTPRKTVGGRTAASLLHAAAYGKRALRASRQRWGSIP